MTIALKRESLLGLSFDCECGKTHEVPVKKVLIEYGAVEKIVELIKSLGLSGQIFLLSDEITNKIAGKKVEGLLTHAGFKVDSFILKGHPVADDRTAKLVENACGSDNKIIVSCGSGTITDLGKWAAFKRNIPQIVVATAPSMNGYASGIVALTKDGLKTTDKVRPAVAIIADVKILSEAPIEMIRAGLGDLLSKSVCGADWKLSSIICGEHFCERPFELIRDLEELYTKNSAGIGTRDPNVIATLIEALIFSGISMVIAGSSSPASGGEHLISHFLDMRAKTTHDGAKSDGAKSSELDIFAPSDFAPSWVVFDLHGAQVGVATLSTARLYERLFKISKKDLKIDSFKNFDKRCKENIKSIEKIFGEKSKTIIGEYKKKIDSCCLSFPPPTQALEGRLQRESSLCLKSLDSRLRGNDDLRSKVARCDFIFEGWDEILAAIRPYVKDSNSIKKVLKDAGAKTHFSELGLTKEQYSEALGLALAIRNRYTVLDLACTAGLTDEWIEMEINS